MAPKMTLTYFDVAGVAEQVRLALAMTGQMWEDKRLTSAEFGALKLTLPFGQVPILEVDGKMLCQSAAILRYVGKFAGIYPEDAFEAACADIAVDAVVDSNMKLRPIVSEMDPVKKAEMRKAVMEDFLPTWFTNLENMLKAAGGEYFAGGKLSIGDIAVACRVDWFKQGTLVDIPPSILDGYPLLAALVERVHSEPRIMAYREARASAAVAAN